MTDYLPPQIAPTIKDVYTLMTEGNAFDTTILTNIGSLTTSFAEPLSALGNAASLFQVADLPDASGLLAQASTVLPSFSQHVSNHFSNLPTNLNLAASTTALNQSLSGLGSDTSNMCGAINDVFGSIMGAGQSLLDTITGALGSISSLISNAGSMALQTVNGLLAQALAGTPLGDLTTAAQTVLAQAGGLIGSVDQLMALASGGLTGALQSLMGSVLPSIQGLFGSVSGIFSTITGAFGGLTDMIAGELSALTGMTSQLLTMAGAGTLASLFNHPCASLVLGAVGSTGLKGALGL